jgi:hypothetical protein
VDSSCSVPRSAHLTQPGSFGPGAALVDGLDGSTASCARRCAVADDIESAAAYWITSAHAAHHESESVPCVSEVTPQLSAYQSACAGGDSPYGA